MTTFTLPTLQQMQRYLSRVGRALLGKSEPPDLAPPPSAAAFPDFPETLWSVGDDYAAGLEGWALVRRRRVRLLIVGLDAAPDNDPARTRLLDSTALVHVASEATRASERHLRALRIHERFSRDLSQPDRSFMQYILERHMPSDLSADCGNALRVQRTLWLIDQIAQEIARQKAVFEKHDQGLHTHILWHIQRLQAVYAGRQELIQFPRRESTYREMLFSTLSALYRFLLNVTTVRCLIEGRGSGRWTQFILALNAAVADMTVLCELFAVTSWPPQLTFHSAHDALRAAFHASNSTDRRLPAIITYDGKLAASVTSAHSGVVFR